MRLAKLKSKPHFCESTKELCFSQILASEKGRNESMKTILDSNMGRKSKKIHFFSQFFLEEVAQFKIKHYFCTAFRKK
jgi:hypothetical protein